MKNIDNIGIQIPTVLLPKLEIDFSKWAVIACDQYTSEPGYWQEVSKYVGESPSTLNLILPELYLGKPDEDLHIQLIQKSMKNYLDGNILVPHEGVILVERILDKNVRYGIILALDLEKYEYQAGSQSLIRATEQTIIERLPPRVRIRQDAPLEIPHIIVLIDDSKNSVIEPLIEVRKNLTKIYDFDLMFGSGHLNGYLVQDKFLEDNFVQSLKNLGNKNEFMQKYGVEPEKDVLLFAVGDGNHSLAAAKSIWEKIKPRVGLNHPARYALVEIENIHNPGLEFKPIHRVLFGVKGDYFNAMKDFFGENIHFEKTNSKGKNV